MIYFLDYTAMVSTLSVKLVRAIHNSHYRLSRVWRVN